MALSIEVIGLKKGFLTSVQILFQLRNTFFQLESTFFTFSFTFFKRKNAFFQRAFTFFQRTIAFFSIIIETQFFLNIIRLFRIKCFNQLIEN